MGRNDFILLAYFVTMIMVLVLIAFAPVADNLTMTMRVWALAESPISQTLVGAFVAAFAGTWGAQKLAERTADRKALLTEIQGTNLALALMTTITNTYINVKKQFTHPLVKAYKSHVDELKNHNLFKNSTFAYSMKLEIVSPPVSHIDEMRQILRDKITPDGSVIVLLTPLVQSVHGFAESIVNRNAWIAELKAMPDNDDKLKSALYFGIPYAPDRVDQRYPNLIAALEGQNDDCIAFSILVAISLVKYCERLAKSFGDSAPKILRAKFDGSDDLIPDMSKYDKWKNSGL